MAKTSKVEDYWRQHCIESLFKELTQILARRMPSDPAVALVEHIQKKYPKSFKISTENIGIVPKTLANNLQLNSIASPVFDIHNESAIDNIQTERRSSTQSQTSGSIKIPTAGSAFTELFKQNTSIAQSTPEMNIGNLVFANRLNQQVVRLRKDIRSDRDILEEELIAPTKLKFSTLTIATTNASTDSVPVDLQRAETHDEPSVLQLIKYKQQVRIENDHRLHREKLAELAKSQRNKEQFFHSDASLQPDENHPYQHQQQQGLHEHEILSQVVPIESSSNRLSHKPFAKSKEEEEILNDENIFQPRKQRLRGRPKQKLTTTLTNTLHAREPHTTNFRSTLRKDDGHLVCKVCGNKLNVQENQSMAYSQQLSITPISHALELQTSAQSIEKTNDNLDDWFESASGALNLRHSTPVIENNIIVSRIGSATFRRDLFRPIHDNDHDIVEHESTAKPLILSDEEAHNKRFKTSRMSESGVFSRSPGPTNRSPLLSQAMKSPVAIIHQLDTGNASNRQSPNILMQNASARSTPSSTFTARRSSTNDRRMSGWSVCEHSPDDTDEN
ncbi:unnamed protein product [Rotaria magnacalcarata]|uniref:Uncharacterized protein n=1 Tax=Rotaria magnacalcarata TaxID=392030 RepID=A0A816MZC3_9BILA|nr:unnamed protein product [Rotaria magnacalcarata]CAF1998947.1 unnamed protein product [Rotaria magnacalcarata]